EAQKIIAFPPDCLRRGPTRQVVTAKAYQNLAMYLLRSLCSCNGAAKRGGLVMMRQTFAALVLLASSSMALAQTPATAPGAAPGASGVDEVTQTQDVTFRTEHDDRMTVPVRVSGSGPYRFLVDTGADRTA